MRFLNVHYLLSGYTNCPKIQTFKNHVYELLCLRTNNPDLLLVTKTFIWKSKQNPWKLDIKQNEIPYKIGLLLFRLLWNLQNRLVLQKPTSFQFNWWAHHGLQLSGNIFAKVWQDLCKVSIWSWTILLFCFWRTVWWYIVTHTRVAKTIIEL